VSAEELRAEWDVHPDWRAQRNRDAREATLPALLELIAGFRSGELDVTEFRRRIDSQSKQKETGVWGFRGNAGVMFFTMLWKGAPDEFAPLLRAAIPVPANDAEARARIDRLRELARATKTRTGNKNIHEAFAPFFLSFFWEAQDRENWPIYHPASRDGLERFGLLTLPADPSEAYVAFRAAVRKARQIVSADAWDLEQFLWCFMHPATEHGAGTGSTEGSQTSSSPEDLYEAVAAAGLRVPESLVTTLVLSLLSKRFVILAGISGTGKTQLPLQLARYLSSRSPGVAVTEAVPDSDERTLYLRVTRSTLKYGVLTVPRRVIDFIELPDRGSGADFTVRLPTGQNGPVRVQNIGFSDESAQHARITLLRATKAWITAAAQPGDIASVALDGDGRPVALGHQTRQVRSSMEPVERDVLIAVRSDWTDPRGLLGYWNPLTARYAPSPLVHLCLRAAEDPGSPYLVILDEMNLARVEYYFSDFLSALESGKPIPLFDPSGEETETDIPSSLPIPNNVLFVGTVNVDETTHAFSPKVLDRANVIEFDDVDLAGHLGLEVPEPVAGFRLAAAGVDPALLASRPAPSAEASETVRADTELMAELLRIHDILETARRHFGYRVANELMTFLGHAVQRVPGDAEQVLRTAFDHQLLQKILPKLTGGRELQPTLTQLLDVCVAGETTASPSTTASLSDASAVLGDEVAPSAETSGARYPRSARKLQRMIERLDQTGYVTFLE